MNTTNTGTIQTYNYLKVITSDQLLNDPGFQDRFLKFLFDYHTHREAYDRICNVQCIETCSSSPNKKAGVSEVAASDTPLSKEQVSSQDFTILLWYNKVLNWDFKSCYDKLKDLVAKYNAVIS